MKKVTSIPLDLKNRTWFSAKMNGAYVIGQIVKQGNCFYFCQDVWNGTCCHAILGKKIKFKYSWSVLQGTERHLILNDVKNLCLYETKPTEYIRLFLGDYGVMFTKTTVIVRGISYSHKEVRAIHAYQKGKGKLPKLSRKKIVYSNMISKFFVRVGCNTVSTEEITKVVKYLNKVYPIKKDLVESN